VKAVLFVAGLLVAAPSVSSPEPIRTMSYSSNGCATRALVTNLGRIHRNFNDPMLPIQVLDPDHQSRFRFALEGASLL